MKKIIIKELNINRFRNLKNININFSDSYNEITGPNGSGKTSILDAIRYLIFNKNSNNSRSKNYQTILPNNETESPDIQLTLSYQNKEIVICHKNEKWIIDGVTLSKWDDANKTISSKLEINNTDSLFLLSNPHLLKKDLESNNSNDNKALRNTFITIINNDSEEKFSDECFDNLINSISEKDNELKQISKDIKEIKNQLETIKQTNTNITNWSLTNRENTKNDSIKELQDITTKLTRYNEINDKLLNYKNDLNNLRLEKSKLSAFNFKTEQNHFECKIKWWEILLTFILFLGLILYLIRRKKEKEIYLNASNNTNTITNNEYKIKQIDANINVLEKNILELENDENYKDVNFEELTEKLKVKQSELTEDNSSLFIVQTYQDLEKKLKEFQNKEVECKNELTKFKNEHYEISKKIEYKLKQLSNDFDIKLFNDTDKERLSVSKDFIDISYLNYAEKMNIVYKIRNLINKKFNNINSFVLIDQIESLNKLDIKDDGNQIIACKVTNDDGLKLNGTNIH